MELREKGKSGVGSRYMETAEDTEGLENSYTYMFSTELESVSNSDSIILVCSYVL
jgi:hypothetical protein